MSPSCFSLRFFFQISLWKFSTFRVYKGIYSRVCEGCEKTFFCKTGCSGDSLATGMSRKITVRLDYPFLSCSTPVVMTLQLPACLTRMAFWWVASHEPLARSNCKNPLECTYTWILHTWILHILSHTALTWFSPKYRVSNYWNTSKFVMK